MKITFKIKLLVIALMILPIAVMFLSISTVGHLYLKSIYGDVGSINDYEQIGNPVDTLDSILRQEVDILHNLYDDQIIDNLNDKELDIINETLKERNTFLVVKKMNYIVYQGVEEMPMGLREQLPDADKNQGEVISYITSPDSYMIRQIDFQFSDGDAGAVYVVSYMGNVAPKFKSVAIALFFIMVMIFTLISGVLSVYMYWSFIRPIQSLKNGTTAIMEGNWDYKVQVDTEDELGELCESFNEMRDQLKQSMVKQLQDEEKNRELIANISHDLKTPITAIKGHVEGIMDGVADTPEKMEKYIRIIYNKANEMDGMINELSLYTKLNSNAIPYNFREVSIDEYMKDCIDELSEIDGLIIHYKNYCDESTKVTVDPEQLHRVVGNIITNSRKYNDKEVCEIDVHLKPVNDMVQISFEDNGIGISEEALPNIFNRTYRADEARRSMGGSGLGLSIAKKVIEEHGGTMWADSKLGVGTTIFFTVQMVQDNKEATTDV